MGTLRAGFVTKERRQLCRAFRVQYGLVMWSCFSRLLLLPRAKAVDVAGTAEEAEEEEEEEEEEGFTCYEGGV